MFSVCTLLDGMVRMAPSRARHACRKEGLRPSVRLMRRHWRQHLQRCVFLQETLQIQAQARSQALLGARLRAAWTGTSAAMAGKVMILAVETAVRRHCI